MPCALNLSPSAGSSGPGHESYVFLSNRSLGGAVGNRTAVVLSRMLMRRTPPLATLPEERTHSPPGTIAISSGPTCPQMNRTFPTGSQPAARGPANPSNKATATDKPADVKTLINLLLGETRPEPSFSTKRAKIQRS